MHFKKLLISAGAMKAGTSYLYKLMERHPLIEVTPVKEIHYFAHIHTTMALLDDPARLHNLRNYLSHLDVFGDVAEARRDIAFFQRYLRTPIDDAWYRDLFCSGDDVFKADFSNMASVLPGEGLRHICGMAEDLRVLYLLRDPFARLWSHVKFHAAVNGELPRLQTFAPSDYASYFQATGAAAHGRYAENIARLRRHIPADRLMIVYFEDMVAAPRRTLGSIFAFLGLAPIDFTDEEVAIVHNPGPDVDMPDTFAGAAEAFLLPLQDRLREAGIPLHPQWRVMGPPSALPRTFYVYPSGSPG